MRRRMRSAALAAAVMAAAIASAALTGAAPAGASSVTPKAPAIKTVIDTMFAGYVTTGKWRYRFVAATVPVAKCRAQANQNAAARIALSTSTIGQAAQIDLFCGGGKGSVRFGTVTGGAGTFGLSPRVGDVLKISIYRNRAARRDELVATNTRTRNTKSVAVRTPCPVTYRHAEFGATLTDISGTWSPPPKNMRLWDIEGNSVTSYNGTRGSVCGRWPAEKHLAAPVITVRMIPSALSNGCKDFSVLIKGSAS